MGGETEARSSWKTACGSDADALGLRRADGRWNGTALKAHVRDCHRCEEFSRMFRLPPFPELLSRLLPLVPHITRKDVELVCADCMRGGTSRTLIESRETATPDRLLEIADGHRREFHSTPDPGA